MSLSSFSTTATCFRKSLALLRDPRCSAATHVRRGAGRGADHARPGSFGGRQRDRGCRRSRQPGVGDPLATVLQGRLDLRRRDVELAPSSRRRPRPARRRRGCRCRARSVCFHWPRVRLVVAVAADALVAGCARTVCSSRCARRRVTDDRGPTQAQAGERQSEIPAASDTTGAALGHQMGLTCFATATTTDAGHVESGHGDRGHGGEIFRNARRRIGPAHIGLPRAGEHGRREALLQGDRLRARELRDVVRRARCDGAVDLDLDDDGRWSIRADGGILCQPSRRVHGLLDRIAVW